MQRSSEAILLAMIILAPWAYGAVEAWAELGLYGGIALVTVLSIRSLRDPMCWSRLGGPPSLALGALTLLACFQASPLGADTSRWIAPSIASGSGLLPDRPERIRGDDREPVPFPSPTISLDPDASLQMALRLAGAWLLFQAVSGLGGGTAARAWFARIIVINAALLALFAIVQSLTWNGCIYWVRPAPVSSPWSVGGPFMSHNHLAAYLNMGLGLALGSLLSESPRDWLRRDSRKIGAAYAAATITAGLVACHSRSGFLGLLVAGLVLILCWRRGPAASWIGLAVVLVTAALYLAILAPTSSFGARLATILDPGDEGYRTRLEVWRAAIRAWWDRPVWGSGFGSFPIAVTPYLSRDRPVFFARAENEYLDLLVEGGALGLFLGLAFVAAIGCLAHRAIRRTSGQWGGDCGFAWGCLFGLVALSVQSLADFGPHVPAVGVMAIALCGQLATLAQSGGSSCDIPPTRLGGFLVPIRIPGIRGPGDRPSQQLESPDVAAAGTSLPTNPAGLGRIGRLGATLAWLGSIWLAGVLLAQGVRDARVENQLTAVRLPIPGTYLPTIGANEGPSWDLEAWRDALQAALRLRPDWAEGHLRLGLVHLEFYRLMAREWLLDSGTNPDESEAMADPLRLLGAVHAVRSVADDPTRAAELLRFDPIRHHLVPAARCFLEARRCSPRWALPHGQLASLDYLLVGGDPASVYADRGLRLAGGDERIPMFLAQVALEVGDFDLAARCWRKALVANPANGPQVADDAVTALSPTQILSDVVQDARGAVEFAGRLYSGPDQREIRELFLRTALDRLEHDPELTDAERFFLQADALTSLGQAGPARQRMEAALTLQPGQSAWREKYIDWLLQWGLPDEAHAQALTGLGLSPDSPTFRAAVDRTADALARGSPEG